MKNNQKSDDEKLLKGLNLAIEKDEHLINNLIEEYRLESLFGKSLISKFKAYSNNDYETFEIFFEKLYYSFKQVQKETDKVIEFDNAVMQNHHQLTRTFMNVIRKEKSGNIKTSLSSYLYISFLNTFRTLARLIENEDDKVPLINFQYEWISLG